MLIKSTVNTDSLKGVDVPANMEVLQETGLAKVYKDGSADIGKFLDKHIEDKKLNEQESTDTAKGIYKNDLITKYVSQLPKTLKFFKFRVGDKVYFDMCLGEPKILASNFIDYISPEEYVFEKLRPILNEMNPDYTYKDFKKGIEKEVLRVVRSSPEMESKILERGLRT